jgi:transposase
MIAVPGGVKVLVATKSVDFRKGAEGVAATAREQLRHNPFSGTILSLASAALSASPDVLAQGVDIQASGAGILGRQCGCRAPASRTSR